MRTLRFGNIAVCFFWSSVSYGFALHKWRYREQASWTHGTAYLWRLKIVW